MNYEQKNGVWMIRCISETPDEVSKIRGLGYIGLLAAGAHHQRHHWMIATGKIDYLKK
jgi:hypothetical protein